MTNLLIGMFFLLVAQVITWYGTNGQFLWQWFREHTLLASLIFGTTSCYFFILATKYCCMYFENNVWPVRILSFCVGIVSFAVLSSVITHEHLTSKTIVCLLLSFVIMLIQILWK